MRAKVFLAVVLAGLALLGLMSVLRPGAGGGVRAGKPGATAAETAPLAPAAGNGVAEARRPQGRLAAAKPAPASRSAFSPVAEDEVQARANRDAISRIAELRELSLADDPISLSTILSELNNPDTRIRTAALDATIQFGSREAIPGLEAAAARADDPQDKRALEQAIEFLKLPSLTEVLEERRQAANR